MKKPINIILLLFTFFFCNIPVYPAIGYEQVFKPGRKIYLDYYDLLELSKTSKPQGKLLLKLDKQLNTPIIKQSTKTYSEFLHGMILGDFFRVASWNIERGFNEEKIENLLKIDLRSGLPWQVLEEIRILKDASIIILNEVDIGLPRTNYENIAEKLADSLKMGYVFGTEFIEVDPYQLGIKKFSEKERIYLEDEALRQLDNVDKTKFYGLHGTAILSKYPILNARIIRLPDCYDWYKEEADKLSALELVRRETAKVVFSSKVLTELRHGGRIAIIADFLLPNSQKITIVATHLENRCLPQCRVKQFEFLLNRLRDIKNPLILAGDLNTTGTDASPVSIKKEVLKKVKDPEFIAKQAILSLTLVQNVVLTSVNKLRQFKDPTTFNLPIILPNKERKIFSLLEEFRFNDGFAFDVRGTIERTHNGYYALLSNSNERETKGYKPTFELERHLGIAKYKLDWFFIKPLQLRNSNDKKASYTYAPHFGRTLSLINKNLGKLSDHDPITVDIPVNEPNLNVKHQKNK